MTTKKLTAILLSVLMILQMFAMSAAAAYIEQAADPADIQYTIPRAETSWMADGIISDGEYSQIQIKPQDLSIAAASDEVAATAIRNPISLYMSYDDNYVYIAATTPADQYVCEIDETNEGNMAGAHAFMLSFTDISIASTTSRLETAYARSSSNGNLYAVTNANRMGNYDPDDLKDYTVVVTDTSVVYEIRVPFTSFVKYNLVEGESFLGSLVWAVGTSRDGADDAYTHIQLGYGITGDPGKDNRGHATFTLGAALPDPDIVTSGTCGEKASWTLDKDGVLTISGAGEIITSGYLAENIWTPEAVTSVVIKEGITSIGDNAFEDCANLTAVSLPESLESIGFRAFCGCTKLTSVYIPDSVSAIDNCAFMDCSALESVQLPTKLTEMEYGLFSGCSSLRSVEIPSGVTAISGSVFYNCKKLESVVIPEGVTTIGEEAFLECDSLQSLTIPSTVKTIGHHFACMCDSLISVVFKGDLPTIDIVPFGTTAEEFTIYYYEGTEGWENFAWSQYNRIMLDANGNPITSGTCGEHATWTINEDDVLIISGTGTMYDYSEYGAPWSFYPISSIVIEDGVTAIGRFAFFDINFDNITISDSVTSIGYYAFASCDNLTNITIPDSVISIAEGAFASCWNLSSITIPDSVTSIGSYAFSNCNSLTTITIPDNVTSIGDDAFAYCQNLNHVVFEGNVPEFGSSAFSTYASYFTIYYYEGTTGWTTPTWTAPDGTKYNTMMLAPGETPVFRGTCGNNLTWTLDDNGVLTISGTGEMYNYYYGIAPWFSYPISSVVIENGVTSIGDDAFSGCSSLASITLPDGMTSIGCDAFSWCENLTSITIPNSVKSIGNTAFNGCSRLESITIPDGVTSIDMWTFAECRSLTSITIPDSVTSIGNYAFYDCDSLADITIPAGVISVGVEAFASCQNLNHIAFEGNIPAFGNSVFDQVSPDFTIYYNEGTAGWTTPTWTAPDGTVYNTQMIAAVVPNTHPHPLETVPGTFSTCSVAGYETYYRCTDETCGKLFSDAEGKNEIAAPVLLPLNSDRHLTVRIINMKDPTETEDGYTGDTYCDDCKTIITKGETIPAINTPVDNNKCGENATWTISEEGVLTISGSGSIQGYDTPALAVSNAPYRNTEITVKSLVIEEGIEHIGSFAFVDMGLESVTIGDSVLTIGQYAFSTNNFTEIELSETLVSIGFEAFSGCEKLAMITIPGTVTTIQNSAFDGCSSMTAVVFLGDLPQHIGDPFTNTARNFKLYYYEGSLGWETPLWITSQGTAYNTVMLAQGEIPVPPKPFNPSYIAQTDDPSTILFDVPYAETEWKADGVISEGEYRKMDVKTSQLSYAVANAELKETVLRTPVSLYMSYDDNYVYIAATTPADKHMCDIDGIIDGNMWAAHAIQLSLADILAADGTERLETGYALSSLDNKLYSHTWSDSMGIKYDPDKNGDYTVVNNGDMLVYEIRVPFEAFVEEKLTAGDTFLGSLVWAVGTSENGGSDAYASIQLGYGITGDPGKDPKGHATFTLAARPHTHTDADGKWESDGTNHWHICSCGEMMDSAAHTGGSATCSSRARCSICGEAYGSYSAYNHTSLSTVNAKAATEFETGYTGDTYCYGCGTTTAYGSVIPATHVHALEAVEAKAATCIAAGNEAYYYCTSDACGKLFSDADGKTELTAIPEIAIDENNHTQLETVNAKDATETEEGYTGDTVCTDCKITVTEGSVIEKLKPAPVLVDVPVEAVVSGSSVVIESVDESILNVGAPETPDEGETPDDGEEPDAGEAPDEGELPAEPAPATVVSIDLTVYETEEEKITEAVLPAQVIETITKVVEEPDNTVEGVAIHLSTGSMQLDDKTMRAMVEQSEGDTVRLVMEDKTGEELNALQEEVLKELEVHGKVDVYMECEKSGDRISEFNGGTVTLQIPFEIPENCNSKGFQVWYIDEEGNRTPMDTRYENGMIIWEVTHFSDYVIIYEEPAVEEMDNPYTDISEDAWYYGDVLYTYANNLMIGVGNEQFAPGMNLTRSMFVTILWRIAGEPVVTDEISFTDVPADTWYTEAVRWAAANGLVNGYSETAFGPNDNITREQLAAILYRYEQMLGGGFTGMWMFLLDFNDRDEISDWAYEAMCYMNMNGIINGKPEKLLDPQGVATRAEAAAMLRRYHEMKNAEQEEN